MPESLAIAIKVLADWRVIAAAGGCIVAWVLLRQVGLVYRKPKPLVARRGPKAQSAPKQTPAPSSDEGEAMVD